MDLRPRADRALTSAPALALQGISKRFGRVVALDEASLSVEAGSVHALLGENGAGKTTLMRIAFGMTSPDAGTIAVGGEELRLSSPAAAIRHGVWMVHQHFTLVRQMSVAENVALGLGGWRLDLSRVRALIRDLGKRTGLVLEPDALVADLSVSAQQRLEIVKALARDARVLILDEPTAVLAPAEARELMTVLRRFALEDGRAVVLITHKLREALAVADRCTVLRRGRTVLDAPAATLNEQTLARAMLGAVPGSEPSRATHGSVGDVIARVTAVEVRDDRAAVRLRGATLAIRRGEIVGIAGVEGAGHRELLRVLAGRLTPSAGRVERPSRVAFVPEDRHREALVLELPLLDNVALRGAGRATGRMRWEQLAGRVAALTESYGIRTPSLRAPAANLSGGNQQKLVLARELSDDPDLLVLENPTRGLDLAASTSIHERLLRARDRGAGVVIYSSDLDELGALADRVVVAFHGELHEVAPNPASVGEAMLGIVPFRA